MPSHESLKSFNSCFFDHQMRLIRSLRMKDKTPRVHCSNLCGSWESTFSVFNICFLVTLSVVLSLVLKDGTNSSVHNYWAPALAGPVLDPARQ